MASNNSTAQVTAWSDPFLVREYAAMVSPQGQMKVRRALFSAAIVGAIEGLAMVAVVPAVTAFFTGKPSWGLGIDGWLLVFFLLGLCGMAASYVQNYSSFMAAGDVIDTIHERMGNQLAKLPLGWFGPALSGRLSNLVSNGVMVAGNGVAHFVAPIVRSLVAMLVLLVGISAWDWRLGLTLLIALPVIVVLTLISRHMMRISEGRISRDEAEFANRIVEYTQAQPALRCAGRSGDYKPLQTARTRVRETHLRCMWMMLVANMINGIGVQLIVVSLIVLTALLGGGGILTPYVTIAFIGICLRFTRFLNDLSSMLISAESARTPLRQIKEIVSASPLPEPTEDVPLTSPGQVQLTDVTFGYDDAPIVSDVSITAQPGTLTAIVGPSGCGKTTLFRLISRFYDVDSGSVRVGGVDVREQTTKQLMAQLSMVFQDVYLYDDTVIANVRVGREDASDEELRRACTLAGVDDIAARLPRGWESTVGEGGRRLSGGERQRVSVARALLKQAPIVLLDEATSALDPDNEHHIEQSINELRATATVLVIAHRLNTVRDADQIVVLTEDGTIAEVGTHDELLARGGAYHNLWQARIDATGWQLLETATD